jgi:ABC-type phosphate transport system substrate-binding protein
MMWLSVALAFALVAGACGDDDEGSGAQVPECLNLQDLYAIFGPESGDVETWADVSTKAEELGSSTELPAEGELQIHGPGTESGTYDAFVELALEEIAEEQGVPEEDWGVGVQYTSSPEDNTIVNNVKGADGALGWVGYAFYEQNADSLRAVQLDGGSGCTVPSVETIGDGSYPLSRPLYIYVNTAKLAEKPALAAFVDLYLNDAYDSVEEAAYIPLPDDDLQATRDAFEAEGVEVPSGDDLSGEIEISGSSTVEPISNLVAELFIEEHGDVDVSVDGPGTGDGFELFCAGDIDIADASRAIDEDEVQLCADGGVEYVELLIGLDGITVMTKA